MYSRSYNDRESRDRGKLSNQKVPNGYSGTMYEPKTPVNETVNEKSNESSENVVLTETESEAIPTFEHKRNTDSVGKLFSGLLSNKLEMDDLFLIGIAILLLSNNADDDIIILIVILFFIGIV